MRAPYRPVALLVTAVAMSACSSGSVPATASASYAQAPQARSRTASGTPIKHVVFIVQENRSFNNLFMSYPGATTKTFGYDRRGRRVALQPIGLETQWDIDHSFAAFLAACNGEGSLPGTDCKMNGWNGEVTSGVRPPKNAPYAYVPQNEIKPYWALAKQYVLADQMFASNIDGSFVAHQYAVAAYAAHTVDSPLTLWGCEGGQNDTVPTLGKKRVVLKPIVACFDFPTIASEADAAHVSWRFYAPDIQTLGGIWSSYQADSPIYNGPDWSADVISPNTQFLTDVQKGKLASITWITPTYADSDHAGLQATGGPAWVASLVDAVGESKFWSSTAIFIMWDDWGGWYDPVKPVFEDYDGLGLRVPLLIVSPYAKQGSVTHVQYETASVLRFMEDTFGLAQLAKADARANDPANDSTAFDFQMKPRPFKKIDGGKPLTYWTQLERAYSQAPRPALDPNDGD